MANFELSTAPQETETQEPVAPPARPDRLDQMYGRMKGMMRVVDENPDHRPFNLYDDLRARLQGTVTVLGEIVKSDPELWSDDR